MIKNHRNEFRLVLLLSICWLGGCATHRAEPETAITPDTRARLVQALRDAGDPAGAAVIGGDPADSGAARARKTLAHARSLIVTGQVDEGLAEARAELAAHADDVTLALETGRLAITFARPGVAGEVYRQLLEKHPTNVEALNGNGVALAQQGQLSAATEAFRQALVLRPDDGPARHNLALASELNSKRPDFQSAEAVGQSAN